MELLLSEEINIELFKFKLDTIPDDISKYSGLMRNIMLLIEE